MNTAPTVTTLIGDCRETLKTLSAESVHTCVTSPPYFGLRDYGHGDQIGHEKSPADFVEQLVSVFREVRRVLRADGTAWLNLGDSYNSIGGGYDATGSRGNSAVIGAKTQAAVLKGKNRSGHEGLKAKDLIGIPWRVAFALQADGWYLRQDIIWHKPNPMPESVTDRCTKAHEYIFLLSRSEKYHFDGTAIREDAVQAGRVRRDKMGGNKGDSIHHSPGGVFEGSEMRNKRSVWTVPSSPFKGAHFATFPPDLIRPCIRAGSPPGGLVLDPFGGSGTTGLVALEEGRSAILCELNPEYAKIIHGRTAITPGFGF